GGAAPRALLDAARRRLYRARGAGAGSCARRHVGELSPWLHRRAFVRPRRLLRPRRLWRGLRLEVSRAEHAAVATLRHAARRPGGRPARLADRTPTRRLFRHGDDRFWPGSLLRRLSVELADRRRRRPARLFAPASRF